MNVFIIRSACALLLTLAVLLLATSAGAWEDCPFGLVNDTLPGKCGLYEDTNSDSICDHSQKSPLLLALAQDTAVHYSTGTALSPDTPKTATPRQPKRSNQEQPPNMTPVTPGPHAVEPPAPRPQSPVRQRYPLWQVFLIVLVLAVFTEILIKRDQRLTLPLQAAWNWGLGLSFLFTFASSLVYVYPALLVKINFNMSYWHSLAGLVMIAAGLYHFIRRFGCMWRGLFSWFRAKDS